MVDEAYLSLVQEVLEKGTERKDRTGIGTISLFGAQRRYDLSKGFPLLTTKKVLYNGVLRELLWFLKGSTNIHDGLKEYTPIWNAWADEKGDLGPIYGYQWRKWEKFTWDKNTQQYQKTSIDQIQNAIDLMKKDPYSRRIIVSAWNPADLDKLSAAPPFCHTFFQLYVVDGRLDLHLYQRSGDLALGVPFNIASYATLLQMFAQECELIPGFLIHSFGDVHIYLNHIEGLKKQLERKPFPLATLKIARKSFWDLRFEDFSLENYQHHDFIKFHVAV